MEMADCGGSVVKARTSKNGRNEHCNRTAGLTRVCSGQHSSRNKTRSPRPELNSRSPQPRTRERVMPRSTRTIVKGNCLRRHPSMRCSGSPQLIRLTSRMK